MFDFRYHALSLIAVLVALVLGLLLGVAIGDKGLVSSAENNIKESLRKDVRSEQKKAADLNDQIAAKEKFEQEVYPLLGDGQLWEDFGKRMGVQLTRGGKLLNTERRALFSSVSGSTGPYDGVVIARNP